MADKKNGGDNSANQTGGKRFRVALSFTGAKRDFVEKVAAILADYFGEEKILYDKYHEAEFARRDLALYLPKLYHNHADLIVAMMCPQYNEKEWTGLEWFAIHDLLKQRGDKVVMLCNFERAGADGLYTSAGFSPLDKKTPEQAAKTILERLAINEGKKKNYYIEMKLAKGAANGAVRARGTKKAAAGAYAPPPEFVAEPPYIGSHEFVGRKAELETIDDWSDPADAHPVLLFEAMGGQGKSMLTWHWVQEHAKKARPDWAGQFWYSFYERGAIMADFIRRALAYVTHVPPESLNKTPVAELREELLKHLKAKPYLMVLDGLERVLVAYHRIDAAQIADDEADHATDQIAKRDPCAAIRPEDDAFLRALAGGGASKILISTRLTPRAMINNAGTPVPGVRHERLKGLRPEDAEALLRAQGITGKPEAMRAYLKSSCDCHPLVTGVLAGLINDYLPARGDFDAWADDAGELGGARLNLAALDLVQKKNHILKVAIERLETKPRQLLSTLALLAQGVDYATLSALNPHVPPPPPEVDQPEKPEDGWMWDGMSDDDKKQAKEEYAAALARYAEYERAVKARLESPEYKAAPKRLQETVKDLEKRGLLQYDHQSKRYDLHPVVRGVAGGGLPDGEKQAYGQRVVDYFNAKPHSPYDEAETLDDVAAGVQVMRTLMQMGKMREAAEMYRPDLVMAMTYNLEAHAEILALLRPFFTNGWGTLPEGLRGELDAHVAIDAGNTLYGLHLFADAQAAYAAGLRDQLQRQDWSNVRVAISNSASTAYAQGRLGRQDRCRVLELDLALAAESRQDLFRARLERFDQLRAIGRLDEAQTMWKVLDPMGRAWSRNVYQQGYAEYCYARFRFERGDLLEEHLARAEELGRSGKNRGSNRNLHWLRGEWHVARGEWPPAAASLHEAVSMARAVGKVDAGAETLLVLARLHAKQSTPDEARHEVERLEASGRYSSRHLAEVWLLLGDRAAAVKHARAAYKSAWADGEPFVYRYELTKAAELLTRLGEPIPSLPPYDAAKDPPFDWEADVEAAIECLKKKKAEKEAAGQAEAAKKQAEKAAKQAPASGTQSPDPAPAPPSEVVIKPLNQKPARDDTPKA